MKHRVLKAAFWIGILVSVPSIPFSYSLSINWAVTCLGTVLGLCVLYGYAYQKPIGPSIIWKFAFVLNLGIWLRAIARDVEKAVLLKWSFVDIGLFVAATLALAITILLVHFLYAFRSGSIWVDPTI